jgi:ATP-dependent DNA helicase DinG
MKKPKTHESWSVHYGLPDWIKDSLIQRAEKRLEDVSEVSDLIFKVKGRPSLGDEFSDYLVTIDQSGRYNCECSSHNKGGYRKSNCSHSIAVRILNAIGKSKQVSLAPKISLVDLTWNPLEIKILDESPKVEPATIKILAKEKSESVEEFFLNEWKEEYSSEFVGFSIDVKKDGVSILDTNKDVSEEEDFDEKSFDQNQFGDQKIQVFSKITCKPLSSLILPDWATELNQGQIQALQATAEAIEGGKRNILLEGPVGMGKTLYGYLVGQMVGARINYICSTKPLQEQFHSDFSDSRILKGRNNYKAADSYLTCDKCNYKKGKGCSLCLPFVREDGSIIAESSKRKCPYVKAKKIAQASDCAVLNTQYFLTANHFGAAGNDNYAGSLGFNPNLKISEGFANRGVSIFDEADELEKALMGFIELTIGPKILEFFKETPPSSHSRWSKRTAWLSQLYEKIREYIREETEDCIESDEDEDPFLKTCKETLIKIDDVKSDIEKLSDNTAEDQEPWVYEIKDKSVIFRPVRVGKYGEKYLFKHSIINIVMSGTVLSPEEFADNIGLKDFEFIRIESNFPAERRPVFVKPVASMTYKNKDTSMPVIAKECLRIRQNYPGRMLIHTVSYELTRYLQDFFADNLLSSISYTQASERDLAIDELRKTKDGILLAPSMDRGVNLKDDLCRIVVIPKIPFPSLGDKQISRRSRQPTKRDGEVWYRANTLRTIIQMTGRGMRHREDWCRTFIIDEQFLRLYKEMSHFMPRWFINGLVFDNRDPIALNGIDTS